MDILAIHGKTVSAVICQLQWREFRRKLKIECCDRFSNFFSNKNWSIDRIQSEKSTKRGGPKCTKFPGGEGEGRRDLSGKEGGRGLLLVHTILIYRDYLA